jgi:hypothetical protein
MQLLTSNYIKLSACILSITRYAEDGEKQDKNVLNIDCDRWLALASERVQRNFCFAKLS